MTTVAPKVRVTQESVEDSCRRLRTFIGRMEHRYECSSDEMVTALASGKIRETAEIARWLAALDFLRELNGHGHTTGTPTRSTR